MREAADEITRLRDRVAKLVKDRTRLRARVAEMEKEAQFLRGAHARCRIELDLAERLLDPSYETTAMDEEYRTQLHDDIQSMVIRVQELEEECRKLDADAANEKAERESWQAMAEAAEELRDKALRYDLDAAGIQQREAEAVELVNLRARVAESKRFWTVVSNSLPPLEVPAWLVDTDKNI
jgi:chromosome segregation ATPase